MDAMDFVNFTTEDIIGIVSSDFHKRLVLIFLIIGVSVLSQFLHRRYVYPMS